MVSVRFLNFLLIIKFHLFPKEGAFVCGLNKLDECGATEFIKTALESTISTLKPNKNQNSLMVPHAYFSRFFCSWISNPNPELLLWRFYFEQSHVGLPSSSSSWFNPHPRGLILILVLRIVLLVFTGEKFVRRGIKSSDS